MNLWVIGALLFLALVSWFALRARLKSGHRLLRKNTSPLVKSAAFAGRDLRRLMLTVPPQDLGVSPTKEFPSVYGISMDWPVGEQTATILATCLGSASLYTTSTFGIIGGEGHASVRMASVAFVKAAGRFYEAAASTSEYPYPAGDKVRFYLLTFHGVRFLETEMSSVTRGAGSYAELFGLGQAVMTELRLTVPETK
jgi:hypothetical protein